MSSLKEVIFQPVIEELKQRSGSRACIILEPSYLGGRMIGGRYHMASHTVYVYSETISQQCAQLFGTLERLEEYAAVVCAHEIGHAEDRELGSLARLLDTELPPLRRAQIALRIEENAWRYARRLLPDVDPAFMEAIIDESLYAYRSVLSADIA